MKIEQKTATIQSTMGGEAVAMGIRQEDMMHIMGILDGLYADRFKAVIREYSTNAWDAHVEAGFSGPVEVSLPTSLHPYLKIRDYGEGLDRDGIREVYSQYGRSTKRDSNEVTGMLGLGSKSALAYNSRQFTVSSIKDGVKITVLVAKNEEGMGVMTILGETETDEASGTEINIGISRDDLYRAVSVAENFYKFWTPGTVTVDGLAPRHFAEDALKLADDLYLVDGDTDRNDYAVMGNVAYPVKLDPGVARNNGGYNSHSDFGLVYIVPIGSVMPAPSREALKDVKSTKDTLALVTEKYSKGITSAVQAEIDNAATPQEAIRTALKWMKFATNKRLLSQWTYNGHPMPSEYEPAKALPNVSAGIGAKGQIYEDGRYVDPRVEVNPINGSKLSQVRRSRAIPVADWPTAVWVTDFEPLNFNATHHNKLVAYCKENNIGWDLNGMRISDGHGSHVRDFVLCRDSGPSSPFIDSKRFIKWEDVKKVKLNTTSYGSFGPIKKIAGSFSIFTEKGYEDEVAGDDLRLNKPVFYRHGNRYECGYYNDMLVELFPEYTLVCLPGNRIEKFKRDVPTAKDVFDAIKAEFKKWFKKQTKQDLRALAMLDARFKDALAQLDPNKVDDKALKADIWIARRDIRTLVKARNNYRSLVNTDALELEDVENPFAKLKLQCIDRTDPKSAEHYYAYINLVYGNPAF